MHAQTHDFAFKRPQPGKWQSAGLAAGMHLLLALFLFYSVRWQTSQPAAVQVELVGSLPPIEAPVRPLPPPPEPVVEKQPEPVVEPPPPPPKPDIAIKEPPKPKTPPKVEPKPEPKPVEKKPEPKPEPKVEKKPEPKVPPKPDNRLEQELQDKLLKESLARESADQMRRQAAQEADLMAKLAADGARSKARETWAGRISAHVKRHVVVPPGVTGNPEAVVAISLLPDGSVVVDRTKLRQSTGNAALDEAILRAIVKSSPLPKPEDPAVFERNLELKFRPLAE